MDMERKTPEAGAFLRAASAAWLAPRRCLVCASLGQPAFPLDIPLCPSCAARLSPIREPRCRICGKELRSEIGLCFSCRESANTGVQTHPIFLFRGEAARLIRAYKQGKHPSLGALWSTIAARVLEERWPGRTVVPVPPRPEKIRAGAWDQVEEIARRLEKEGIAVARVLLRTKDDQQKRLSKASRAGNALAAYALDPFAKATVPEKAVILDDVRTTGATIEACAAALLGGGAKEISALVLAAD